MWNFGYISKKNIRHLHVEYSITSHIEHSINPYMIFHIQLIIWMQSHSILIHNRYLCSSITSPTCIRYRSKENIVRGAQVSLRTLQSDERGSKRSDEPTTCDHQYQSSQTIYHAVMYRYVSTCLYIDLCRLNPVLLLSITYFSNETCQSYYVRQSDIHLAITLT